MRTLLFVVLPLLIIGGIAYHYRDSWVPKLSTIGRTPDRQVTVSVLPAPPVASPVPTPSPTAIPEVSATPSLYIQQPVADVTAAALPASGPTDWLLEVGAVAGTVTAAFSVVSARLSLRRAVRNIEIL
jgi:hypothetical protein